MFTFLHGVSFFPFIYFPSFYFLKCVSCRYHMFGSYFYFYLMPYFSANLYILGEFCSPLLFTVIIDICRFESTSLFFVLCLLLLFFCLHIPPFLPYWNNFWNSTLFFLLYFAFVLNIKFCVDGFYSFFQYINDVAPLFSGSFSLISSVCRMIFCIECEAVCLQQETEMKDTRVQK